MSLRSLPDFAILNRIKRLVRCEHAFTLRVLECLIEVEYRKLHFALGYSSMFTFCTSGLGYSGSAAGRRIQAARTVVRFPEVMDLLRANEVNVCTVSRVSRILTPDNKDEILTRIRRRSLDEVIAIVAEYRPPSEAVRDRVRDVMVQPPRSPLLDSMPWRTTGAAAPVNGKNTPHALKPANFVDASRTHASTDMGSSDDAQPAPVTPDVDLEHRIVLRFGVSREFMAKLDRIRAIAWHRLPANATLEHIFELVLDDSLKRSDPFQRREHRSRREPKRSKEAHEAAQPSSDVPHPRRIPLPVRDEVFVRDQGRCTFVGPDGHRCDATRGLQIDHIVPVAKGGSGEIGNLRLLCAHHNQLLAERLQNGPKS